MKRIFLPLFTAPSTVLGRKTIFYTLDEKVTVEAPGKLVHQLIALCDGTRAGKEIARILKKEWDGVSVKELTRALRRKKILVDARQIGEETWRVITNPPRFPSRATDADAIELARKAGERHRRDPSEIVYSAEVGPLGSLLSQRQSTRSFSGAPVAFQDVINILWSAYGELKPKEDGRPRRTVPSAGALYPLIVHIALFKQTGDLQPAIYSIYLGHSGSVGFRFVSYDVREFSRAFLNPIILEKAHGVIVISGSFRITGEKYGNRDMLYVPLEAGHAAQNVHLAAVEESVATVEIGGFVEKLLAEAINLQKHYHPLTTVVFGCKDEESQVEVLNQKLEVQWVVPVNDRYRPPFSIASARVSVGRSWSHGRDASPVLAYTKAVAEAKEWAACGGVPDTLVRARLADLKTAVDPRSIIKFHPAQYHLNGFPFKPFDEKTEYAWTEGYDEETGSVVHILADLVYFPYFPKTPYYAYANSSGVAAHPNRQNAVETSALELVERDSFMIAYLAQLEFPTVREQTLPQSIRKRIQELKKIGFRTWIKNHSLDLAPVACVLAQSEELTYTPCASCASFDIEHAVNHALMEVEALVLARLQNGPATRIKYREVVWPLDHGKLYGQRQYFHYADFLIRGRNLIAFQDIGRSVAQSWQELLDRFAAKGWTLHVTIPLYLPDEYGGNGGLHIIRSIVPGMVPMTFGYRQEPAGMERIYAIAKEFGNKRLSYQKLAKFPHPFA